ncbi:MAG: response regulator [Rhodovibrionaceae bacterium]
MPQAATLEESAAPESFVASRGAVLIVDDEDVVRRSFRRILERAGYACHAAASAEEGLAYLEAAPGVSVVISDIAMPGEDGIAFLGRLRARFADRPWLQVLLVTGDARVELMPGAVQNDASDFLLKPLCARDLLSAVENAFTRAERQHSLQRTLHSLASQLASGPLGFDRSAPPAAAQHKPRASWSSSSGRPLSAEAVQRLIAWQRRRDRRLGESIFGDPAWSMLLELYGAELLGLPMPVSSLCIAAETPATTALRRIAELEAGGLVVRRPDERDRRRVFISLTADGREKLEACLENLLHDVSTILAEL